MSAELNPQDVVPSVSIEAIVQRRDALIAAYLKLRKAVGDHVKPLEAAGVQAAAAAIRAGLIEELLP